MTDSLAAICRGDDAPWTIEPVTLAPLRPDEVLVRIVACGICHTDLAVRSGQLPVPLPAVLGHEGAGIVEAVGDAVTAVEPGDRVLLTYDSCGECRNCRDGAPTYCDDFLACNMSGARRDGTASIHQDGAPVSGNFFGQSSFATVGIAHERNVVRVPDIAAHLPLEQLAPLGCGLMTGAGSVLRSLEVRRGTSFAVFGAGTVGLAAIMAAKIVGAHPIIAVDRSDSRLALAASLGATHVLQADDGVEDAIRTLCPSGLAYALDTTGLSRVIDSAIELLGARGKLGILGACGPEDRLAINTSRFIGVGRTLIGIHGGDSDIAPFICELIAHHIAGDFPFERLLSHFDFAAINEAMHACETGAAVKAVLRMTPEG